MKNKLESYYKREEREAQAKIEVETTYSKSTGEVLVIRANGIEIYPKNGVDGVKG